MEDYEMQSEGTAGDEEIAGALAEARLQLEKQRGDQDSFTDPDINRICQDVIVVASDDRFRQLIASPGINSFGFFNIPFKKRGKKLFHYYLFVTLNRMRNE